MKRKPTVVGYFASIPGTTSGVCDGDALVIAGSPGQMKRYVRQVGSGDPDRVIIRKTTYQEIARGLELGAAYTFDEAAFARFLPLARAAGREPVDLANDPGPQPTAHAIRLRRVQWVNP